MLSKASKGVLELGGGCADRAVLSMMRTYSDCKIALAATGLSRMQEVCKSKCLSKLVHKEKGPWS